MHYNQSNTHRNIITIISIMSILLLATSPVFAGTYPKEAVAWRGTTPVLDGYISPGEWDDAESFTGVTGWNTGAGSDDRAPADDLSLTIWIKHDGEFLYFAFDVTDDVMYGFDTERWLPDAEKNYNQTPHAPDPTGWPWFGDGVEIMLNPTNVWDDISESAGDGTSFQMCVQTHKSILHGFDEGGLTGGEPRVKEYAWNNYMQWINNGDMVAKVRVKSEEEGSGYVVEWKMKPDPCLQVADGQFWNPDDGVALMGLQFEVQDLDTFEVGDLWGNFHHVDVWASGSGKTNPKNWGTLRIEPGVKDPILVAEEPQRTFELLQNFPNPFNPATTISFNVETAGHLRLDVYNIAGQVVNTLIDGTVSPGSHNIVWNGTDRFGNVVSAGQYICRLHMNGMTDFRKMLFMK